MNVIKFARKALSLGGDAHLAELGVYEGRTAEAICKVKSERSLHLFDTFKGLPASMFSEIDTKTEFARRYIWKNAYSCSLKKVKSRLKNYSEVYYHKGVFPKSAKQLKHIQYCFVHLDADLYLSILEGIKFFYPRLIKGGLLLIHNYDDFEGVRLAVSIYFPDRQIERVGFKHCLITKM